MNSFTNINYEDDDNHFIPSEEFLPTGTRTSNITRVESHETMRRRKLRESTENVIYPSSLDFERVVNQYSIQATKDRLLVLDSGGHWRLLQDTLEPTTDALQDLEPLLRPTTSTASSQYKTFGAGGRPPPPPPPVGGLPPPPPPPPPVQKDVSGMAKELFWSLRQKPTPLGYTGRTATRWVLTILTGLCTGIISIVIVTCTQAIETWRSDTLDSLWRHNQRSTTIFAVFAGGNLLLVLLSSLLCIYVAPQAVGSGIPEVKAYLNGVRVHRFASLRLFLVKIFATILSVSSALVVGPEGPLVHTGAMIGASCTKLYNVFLSILPNSLLRGRMVWSFVIQDLAHFAHDSERRDLVSIGAAAGFAAAFGAPIGGLLFSLEEASTYFDQPMFLRSLSATAVATFMLAVHHGNLSDYSIISLGNFHTNDANIFLTRVEEIPLYILVAVVGGVLGGLFVNAWKLLQVLRRRIFPQPRARRLWNLFQVAFVSLLTSSLLYYMPLMKWTCRRVDVNDDLVEHKSVLDQWKFHPHQFGCPTGYIDELATIFFGSREDTISAILTDPMQFKPRTLWVTGATFFVLMTLTLGVAIPSGIFMPTFLIGSSLGGAAGVSFRDWLGQGISPSTFALLGAAALLAGIQRSTVSLCVIMVEGTGQVKVLLPVIITVVVARYVGDLISGHGLYEIAMELNHYPYLDHEEKKKLDIFTVSDIMSAPVVTIGPRERAHTLVKLLRETEHHGYPVVDPITKKFMGLVRRDQLVALIECGVYEDDQYFNDEDSSTQGSPSVWTPKPGVGKSPLMHLAYHITDDRYDHMEDDAKGGGPSTSVTDKSLSMDEYDSNAWLLSVRRSREHLDCYEEASTPLAFGDDSLPPLSHGHVDENVTATVGLSRKGNVYIKWLHPACKRKYVTIGAVVNRGSICVNDFCPVSKARQIFTAMGLRHLIVLGDGGRVVGILTRINFLNEYIEERTRCFLSS